MISCSVYKLESWLGAGIAAQEQTGHQVVGVSNCTVHHLVSIFFY